MYQQLNSLWDNMHCFEYSNMDDSTNAGAAWIHPVKYESMMINETGTNNIAITLDLSMKCRLPDREFTRPIQHSFQNLYSLLDVSEKVSGPSPQPTYCAVQTLNYQEP
ncbi:MAG: hypothetical protein U5Q03_12430 [Bacteroidota bacterium]|nr:hypothetical protein [Bacteroidota bacterium]